VRASLIAQGSLPELPHGATALLAHPEKAG